MGLIGPWAACHFPSPTPTSVNIAEDAAGSVFGFKLNSHQFDLERIDRIRPCGNAARGRQPCPSI